MPEIVKNYLRGFLMGSADIVPGVSGGTVALIVGIYERLIHSVSTGSKALVSLAKGDFEGFKSTLAEVEWPFLIALLAGIGTAVVALSAVLATLLEERPVELAGLFTGFVAASVVIAWGMVRERGTNEILIAAAMAVATFFIFGLREATSTHSDAIGDGPALWAYLIAGTLAICAMILPGISGSFILVLIGMYSWVIAAVNDRDLVAIALVGIGCVAGLAVFSQLLNWLLERHYNVVMAALVGLMIGSMRVLWPWPKGVDSTALEAPSGPVAAPIALALVVFVVVVGFERLATKNAAPGADTDAHVTNR